MHTVQEIILPSETFNNLTNLLNEDSSELFIDSEVFNSQKGIHENLPEIRKSKVKYLKSPKLINLCEEIVNSLSTEDCTFQLRKTDSISQIHYETGGYFEKHEDYLSVTSNLIIEYTLIICINADCTGGLTVLHFNKNFKHESKSTTTPGHGLLFRKDISHEGLPVIGTKDIITLDVFSTEETTDDKIIVIQFKNDKRFYSFYLSHVIKICTEDNIFSAMIDLQLQSQIKNKSNIYIYQENEYTFDELKIISDIFSDRIVSQIDVELYSDILDFFSIGKEFIFSKQIDRNNIDSYFSDDNLIIFTEESDYKFKLEQVKQDKDNYIPIELVFVEGNSVYVEGNSADLNKYNLECILVTAGEEFNIIEFQSLFTGAGSSKDQIYITNTAVLKYYYNLFMDIEIDNKCYFYDKPEILTGPENIPENKNNEFKDFLIKNNLNLDNNGNFLIDSFHLDKFQVNCLLYLNSNNWINHLSENKCPFDFQVYEGDSTLDLDLDLSGEFYNIKNNKLIFERKHFKSIVENFYNKQVIATVREYIQDGKINFKFKQNANLNIYYCNESLYGNVTILKVYCLMKMEN